MQTELFQVTFTTDDLDWMAVEEGVSHEVATERAEQAAKQIRDRLIELGNEMLLDAIGT